MAGRHHDAHRLAAAREGAGGEQDAAPDQDGGEAAVGTGGRSPNDTAEGEVSTGQPYTGKISGILSKMIDHSVNNFGAPRKVTVFVPATGEAATIHPTDHAHCSKFYGREVLLENKWARNDAERMRKRRENARERMRKKREELAAKDPAKLVAERAKSRERMRKVRKERGENPILAEAAALAVRQREAREAQESAKKKAKLL